MPAFGLDTVLVVSIAASAGVDITKELNNSAATETRPAIHLRTSRNPQRTFDRISPDDSETSLLGGLRVDDATLGLASVAITGVTLNGLVNAWESQSA